MNPLEMQAAALKTWFDVGASMMQMATQVWAPQSSMARAPVSTLTPWWMPPQTLSMAAPTAMMTFPGGLFDPRTWMPSAQHATGLGALGPWAMPAPAWSTLMGPWAQWAALMAPMAAPAPAASANPFAMFWPLGTWFGAPAASAAPSPWTDPFAAYRSASGHATAAIVRAMSPPAPPKPSVWPFMPPYGVRYH